MGICRHCGAGKVFENWKRTGFMEMDMDAGVSKPIKDLMYENSRGINM